ncbi:ANE_G0012730.mRNA.1.CDS.1 [Saccharomyces cerevisiae]|nr:AVI_1a_G0012700.mRNA.1.CDS.1 [Saccharomyces cerevisiae]CAI4381397.1 ANE_G0012730.mRNA.1.CDS.1 [Saccharomyces cerevisiae]CAI6583657.1 ANE_G0012730.mRNA.1.CDS.1 [Saccharomyces cerevisiae]CAI7083652.1 AVI_1a_G0012700.mRNA.1.CDS.1 [Saccharomyces cerevisiae]
MNGPSLELFENKVVKLFQNLERLPFLELFEFQSYISELSQQFSTSWMFWLIEVSKSPRLAH